MQHGPFALPITQYLKPPQVQQFLEETCCLTSHSWLTGKKIGDYRQQQTVKHTKRENNAHVNWDYQPGDKVLLQKDSIFSKTES